MPWSADEGKLIARQQVEQLMPAAVLDIGAGAGYYGRMVKRVNPDAVVHAVEIWKPYVRRFQLESDYDKVFVQDARKFEPTQDYDLVILGDVLEHMMQDEAIEVVERLSARARYILISLPIIHWEQGADAGNPYETHVHHWDDAQVSARFSPFFSWTGPHIGVYLIRGALDGV